MAEDKRTTSVKDQATSPLIQGKTKATIEEAITTALTSGDARPPMRITRGMNNNEFQLKLQRNIEFSTGGMYGHLTRAQIGTIVQQHFASREEAFKNWVTSDDNTTPFNL